MFLIGPRNLLCFQSPGYKQIPRFTRNDGDGTVFE